MLIQVRIAFVANAEIVEGGQVRVQLKTRVLMVLPVLPVQRLVSQGEEPGLRIVHISSLIQGEVGDLGEATEDLAMLTEHKGKRVLFVITVLVKGVSPESISASTVQQSELELFATEAFQE